MKNDMPERITVFRRGGALHIGAPDETMSWGNSDGAVYAREPSHLRNRLVDARAAWLEIQSEDINGLLPAMQRLKAALEVDD